MSNTLSYTPETITLSDGREIVVSKIKFKQIGAATQILSSVKGKLEAAGKNEASIMEVCLDELAALACLASTFKDTGEPLTAAKFDELDAADGLIVMMANLEANKDFFSLAAKAAA